MAASNPLVSGAFLVLAPAGLMPPRLLLAQAGTRLPAGVYAVAVASAPGSARGGAVRAVAAGAGAGNTGGVLFLAPEATRVPSSGATRSVAAGAGDTSGVLFLAPATASSGATRSVAAGATSEAGNNAAADDGQLDLEGQKNAVLESWAAFERGMGTEPKREAYEVVCFDEDVAVQMKATASKGATFVAKMLRNLGPKGFSDLNVSRECDINNLKIAGLRFLLVLSEANKGYVRPSSVREAATATLVLCVATLSTASLRLDAGAAAILDQPAPKEDPASYFSS